MSIRGLYVIIDPDACGGRDPVDVARQALAGGASIIQWRDKRREKGVQLADARALGKLCKEYGALYIVNDHVDLALAVAADGVHVGQGDLPADVVRGLVPDSFVIGASTNNVDEARAAEVAGASYIAVGSMFPTASKEPERTRAATPERLREVKAVVDVPVVGIGGIDASTISEVLAAGADAVAVISAVCGAEDPKAAAEALVAAFN
ncbi:MAG: thiamine phosphate synthase [Chloroflexi bacterium]|nr:thiamine phosphate synthase [Chloroflexota bacterium]